MCIYIYIELKRKYSNCKIEIQVALTRVGKGSVLESGVKTKILNFCRALKYIKLTTRYAHFDLVDVTVGAVFQRTQLDILLNLDR